MIDVFIATLAKPATIRGFLYQAVVARWQADALANAKVFTQELIPREHMQRERRIIADLLAASDIYVLTDDDCMPLGRDFIERGVKIMRAHPEFAVLAAMNIRNAKDKEPYTGRFLNEDVWECHAVGGIRFCRKGAVKNWPPPRQPGSYDMQHQAATEAAGFKQGYLRTVLMNHIGEGLSTHWPPGRPEISMYEKGELQECLQSPAAIAAPPPQAPAPPDYKAMCEAWRKRDEAAAALLRQYVLDMQYWANTQGGSYADRRSREVAAAAAAIPPAP